MSMRSLRTRVLGALGAVLLATAAEAQFEGAWDTTFGRMELTQVGDQVTGTYEYGPNSTLEGTVVGRKLELRYVEPAATGQAWFVISPDGSWFTGQWLQDGAEAWADWEGVRAGTQAAPAAAGSKPPKTPAQ